MFVEGSNPSAGIMKPYEVGIWKDGDLLEYIVVKAGSKASAQTKALKRWVAKNLDATATEITVPKCSECGNPISPHDAIYDGLCQECRKVIY